MSPDERIADLEMQLEDISHQLRGIVVGHPNAASLTPVGIAAVVWQMYTGMAMGREKEAARIVDLEAALAPFAGLAEVFPESYPDDNPLYAFGDTERTAEITWGDCRRARDLLKKESDR